MVVIHKIFIINDKIALENLRNVENGLPLTVPLQKLLENGIFYKAYQKAYQKTDKYKSYHKTDKYKAYQKAYQKTYHKTDKYKAYKKAYQKAYYQRTKLSIPPSDKSEGILEATL